MHNDISKFKIIFLGSPEIGAVVLNELLKSGLKIEAVVTRPDRPCGRGCKIEQTPVKKLALDKNIKVFQPASKQDLTDVVSEIKPDICIVAAYGMIIPNEALDLPKYGMINFHPSLLPELRGPSPIPMAIMCGHQKTGVTIIQISEKMDAGDILAQKEVTIKGTETTPTLSEDLAKIGAKMIVEVIENIENGPLQPKRQDESKATFTPIIKKSDGEILFQKYHAQNIEQAARAFTPWPGIYTTWSGKRLEIFEPEVIIGKFEPGKVTLENNRLIIGCAKNAIAPKALKIEGKNKQTAEEFICGYQNFIGSVLK